MHSGCFYEMNSSALRIAATARPPFVFYAGNRTGISYTGLLIDLLPTLLGYAQISASPDFTYYPADEPGELVDGRWTGGPQLHPVREVVGHTCPPQSSPELALALSLALTNRLLEWQ